MITTEVGFERSIQLQFLTREPANIVVEVLDVEPLIPTIQRRLQGSIEDIRGVEMAW